MTPPIRIPRSALRNSASPRFINNGDGTYTVDVKQGGAPIILATERVRLIADDAVEVVDGAALVPPTTEAVTRALEEVTQVLRTHVGANTWDGSQRASSALATLRAALARAGEDTDLRLRSFFADGATRWELLDHEGRHLAFGDFARQAVATLDAADAARQEPPR